MKNPIQHIEKLLAHHRAEIERLETALDVLRRLDDAPPPPAKVAKPAGKMQFVVRKKKTNGKAQPKRNIAQEVRTILAAGTPMTSGEIVAAIDAESQKHSVHTCLSTMKKEGAVTRDADRRYSLPVAADGTSQ